LFKAYEVTIKELESNIKFQPKRRKMPCLLTMFFLLMEAIVMILFVYMSFLIIQLALFNLVIIGIIFVMLKKIFYIAETIRWKLMFNKKTKDF
jgi:hypothetical protein